MAYDGPTHMYGTYVSDILIRRGDFAADWWEMVQPRVYSHLRLGTEPSVLADIFSEEWRMIRDSGGWRGRQDEPPKNQPSSKAMQDTLHYCRAAKRRGFA